jgi:uncharacterized protein YecE (DUF72 family)
MRGFRRGKACRFPARRMKAGRIRIGTSGWSYKDWTGEFYPKGTKPKELLEFYARNFGTVEINSSFYHLPTPKAVRGWHDRTPRGFIFSCKASRYITHMKRLKDPKQSLKAFFRAVRPLKEKMGPVLVQLPPSFSSNLDRLKDFLDELPRGYRYVFEFRHRSWFTAETYKLLRGHNAALCFYHLKGFKSPEIFTADFVYIRLHGPAGAYQGSYSAQALAAWSRKIRRWSREKRDVYCYFDNDQKTKAALNAADLQRMINKKRKPS